MTLDLHRRPMPASMAGRTLIELLIAMMIGVIVIGAVMGTVISTSASSRTQNGMAKLSEDAQIALNLVSGHLRMAGFSSPRINALPGTQFSNYEGAAIRGCDSAFNPAEPVMANLVCAGAGAPNAFSIAYEADDFNTLSFLPGQPTDCLGQNLVAQASPFGGNFFVAENRFFLRPDGNGGTQLACAGIGDNFANPQTMVNNVEDMRLTYGIGNVVVGPFGNQIFEGRVLDYLRADEIDAHPVYGLEPVMNRWRRVSSVRICLVMRSDDGVTDQPTPYFDCTGALVNPADRRLRTSVSTTIDLRNATAAAL